MDLGDKHQTTPREATNDPGNDNLNALKNAHLTPRAIKAVRKGVDIKNEDNADDGTTDGRKSSPSPKKTSTPRPVKRSSPTPTPKPQKKNNVSTKVQVTTKASPKTSTRTPDKPKKVSTPKPKAKSSGGSRSPFVSLIDLIGME